MNNLLEKLKISVKYLQLMRWPNLLIVAGTMYAMRLGLVAPMLAVNSLEPQFPTFHFMLLVLTTMLITAGGYVINDYFDVRTDHINRPDEVLVGTTIKRREALLLHWTLNTVAILIALYLSISVGHWQFTLLFVGTTGLLWYYSTHYKRQFLIGNIVVSVLTGLVPFLVLMYEMPMLNSEYAEWQMDNHTDFLYIVKWVSAYSFFAFLTTMIRELIKDVEDFEGDRAYGRDTLPVVLGIATTKMVIFGLIAAELAAMLAVYFIAIHEVISLAYFIVALLLPFAYLVYVLRKATKKADYTRASLVVKLIMLAGLGYLGVVYYQLSLL